MANPTALNVKYQAHFELLQAWQGYLRHDAFAHSVEPPPPYGAPFVITLTVSWEEGALLLMGTVLQSAGGLTFFQIEALTEGELHRLQLWGVPDDAIETVLAKRAKAASRAKKPAPEAEAAAPLRAVPTPPPPTPTPPTPPPPTPTPPTPPASPATLAAPPPPAPRPPAPPPPSSAPRVLPQPRVTPVAPPRVTTPRVRAATGQTLSDIHSIARLSGPATHDTEQALPALERWGDLGEVPWRDCLMDFLDRQVTGIVVIHAFREVRWAYVVQGRPVHYTGDKPHTGEFLSDALIQERLVTAEQWREAVLVSKLTGIRPSEFLEQRGWLTHEQLLRGLHVRASRITERLLSANFGKWSFHPLPALQYALPYPGVDVVPVLWNAERRVVQKLDDEEVVAALKDEYQFHIQGQPTRLALMTPLATDEEEAGFLQEYVPAGWTLKEMVAMGVLPEQKLLRLTLRLRGLGAIRLVESEGEDAARNRAERKLFIALRDITKLGAFEALHCHWTSVQHEIEAGYKRVLDEWSYERFAKVMDDRLRGYLDRLHARARETYEQLNTAQGREQVRDEVITPSQRFMAIDLLGKQVEMEEFKTRWGIVRVCYERIAELAPDTAEGQLVRKNALEKLREPQIAAAKPSALSSDFDGYALGRQVDAAVE